MLNTVKTRLAITRENLQIERKQINVDVEYCLNSKKSAVAQWSFAFDYLSQEVQDYFFKPWLSCWGWQNRSCVLKTSTVKCWLTSRSPSRMTSWSTIDWHLHWYSVNTQLTSQLTVTQESTNFWRHAMLSDTPVGSTLATSTTCLSIVNQDINWVSI